MSDGTLSATSSFDSRFPVAKALWILIAGQILFGALAAMTSWALALTPFLVLLALIPIVSPRAGVFLLAVSLFLRIEIPGLVGVYPGDLIALLLIGGLVGHLVIHGFRQSWSNPALLPLVTMLAVFAASLAFAFDPKLGIVNWLRHVQMVITVLVVAETLTRDDVGRLLKLVLWSSLVLAIPNIIEAIRLGGAQRVFGIASLFFPFYLATAIMYCCSIYLLHENAWKRKLTLILLIILGVAIIASQTREAMLYVATGVVLTCFFAWWWARRNSLLGVRRRIRLLIAGSILAVVVFLSGSVSVFERPADRVYQAVEGHSNTIFIRLFLWKTGVRVFLDSPVLGTGLGQNSQWDKFLPFWRFDPMAVVSRGLGVHNDLITYAAETGVIGLAAIFWFFSAVTKTGWRACRVALTHAEFRMLLAVWVPCLATCIRFFYGTHTFYSLGGLFNCLYFGMLLACARELTRAHTERATLT